MHFSKTYAQLLLDLPPDLRDNAVQYRQLKKVINQIVGELSSLGLKPALLHELIEASEAASASTSTSTPSDPVASTSAHDDGPNDTAHDTSADSTRPSSPEEHGTDSVSIPAHESIAEAAATDDDAATAQRLIRLSAPRVVYELNGTSGRIEPQLRISVRVPLHLPKSASVPSAPPFLSPFTDDSHDGSDVGSEEGEPRAEEREKAGAGEDAEKGNAPGGGHTSLLWAFQKRHFSRLEDENRAVEEVEISPKSRSASLAEDDGSSTKDAESIYSPETLSTSPHPQPHSIDVSYGTDASTEQEIVIPLVHDTEFYNLLSTTLESIAAQLSEIHGSFVRSLEELSRAIADTAQPASVAAQFHPLSAVGTHAGAVRVRTGELKSDLYAWREIFQIYLEAEVFESVSEATRGERSIEESERRLQQFAERVTKNGLGDRRQFKLKQSMQALETFLSLNLFILNVKKFSHANSEATRKILKKHTKRTALFFPGLAPGTLPPSSAPPPLLALAAHTHPFSLPRLLVQALGETLLPIVPSVEDYACLICTSLAFKPIRLRCGHLFCVRCLVKMQKRRKEMCPMCRAPSVLVANRSNVDWALLNFMQDWFPIEAREKLKNNEREASEEELRELGIDPNQSCVVM
ncbi:hypothetical protein BDN70DRAFT_878342 [Pholiota conissans]|uniref:SPX domain-containing protein n=1 Tax=Pholiota conissans TaxID=109636 RepID=A0A9P6D1L9_9AGAR|nr:hypothetical protein BDN70DRAFT_878342 [Pholiota conissans]